MDKINDKWGEFVITPALMLGMDGIILDRTLLLDSGVLADQQLNERTQQRFAALADIVHKLEETQVEREFLLRNAPMRAKPTPK